MLKRKYPLTHTQIYLTSMADRIETENYIYDFYNMIGDVGGVLGLLLGASIMSLYDDLIKYVEKKRRRAELVLPS